MGKEACDVSSPKFWLEQWKSRNRNSAKEPWSACRCMETWDEMAQSYGREDKLPTGRRKKREERRHYIIGLLEERGALRPGARVLDVGCGTGTWALAFAERGAEVVGVDFSGVMIERMNKETPTALRNRVTSFKKDWHDLDIEASFAGAFDLVFANMTPAINDSESFLKLIKSSREWCFYCGWAGIRREPLMEKLWLAVTGKEKPRFRSDIIYPFNLVYSMGFSPFLEFQDVEWKRETELQEAIGWFSTFFSRSLDRPVEEMKRVVGDYLRERASNGRVTRKTTGRTGFMIWRVA